MATSFTHHRTMLLTYLKPQAGRVALLAALLLGSIGLQLIVPQILSRFIDAARAGAAPDALLRLAVVFLMVALIGQVSSAIAVYASATVGWTATNLLRADLARHCLHLDLSFHSARTPGEMIERVDGDITQLSGFFSQMVIQVLGNTLLLAGILALLSRVDWRVGLAYAGFTVIGLIALRRTLDIAVPHWKQSRQANAMLIGFLEERLSGTEDIRSSGAVPYVMRRLALAMREQLQRARTAWLIGTLPWAAITIVVVLGYVLAFGFGAYLLSLGAITLGTVYLFFHYTEMLRRPLEQITRQIQDLQRASASIDRVADLLALEPAVKDGVRRLPPGPLSVEFRDVSFGYVPDDPVLRELTFRLEPGRVLGLLGRTGSGKTTIGRLLVRLYDTSAGSIRLGGIEIRDVRLGDLRQRIGIVTQDVQLFHATVRDNLTFFDPTISDHRITAVLDTLGLREWCESLPQGLDTPLVPRGGLSAGEAQLLALARLFFKDPGLVILDEASSRLDPATERLVEGALAALLRGRTAIIVAHRLATVERADAIMIIEDGRIVEHGPRRPPAENPASRFAGLLRTGLEEVLA